MVTVLRAHGLRVVIYNDDHPPPHVHVLGDGETKIALNDLRVIRVVGASFAESRRAARIVRERRDELLRRWSDIHG